MKYYICFNYDGLDEGDIYVETQLKEARKYSYFIEINDFPAEEKGKCLAVINLEKDK